jgi:hypothetical protein
MKTTRKQLSSKALKALDAIKLHHFEVQDFEITEKEMVSLLKKADPTYLMRRDGMTYQILAELQDWANVPMSNRLTIRQKINRDIKRKQAEIEELKDRLKFIGDMP